MRLVECFMALRLSEGAAKGNPWAMVGYVQRVPGAAHHVVRPRPGHENP
jgi:hypothetical protein